MEELHQNLQPLIEKAWDLHDKITDEIHNCGIGLRGFCSGHDQSRGVAETPFVERERLIAIRDALEMVEKMLMFLQRLQSHQQIDRHVAIMRLEESRLFLIKRVKEHRGRSLDVVHEMLTFFGDKNDAFNWNINDPLTNKVNLTVNAEETRKSLSSSIMSFFQILLNPWKWKIAAKLTLRSFVVLISVMSMIHFQKTRQQISSSWRRRDSSKVGNMGLVLHIASDPLNVFWGRG